MAWPFCERRNAVFKSLNLTQQAISAKLSSIFWNPGRVLIPVR